MERRVNMYPKFNGGVGPSGFDPSQKQSIGVIQMHGIIRSRSADTNAVKGPGGSVGAGGLKQMSAKVHFLNYFGFICRKNKPLQLLKIAEQMQEIS